MTAHRMTEDALPLGERRKVRVHELGKLARHVAVHPVVRGPRCLRGVDIEASAKPEIPARIVAGQPRLARARVRRDQHQPELGREALRAGLDHESFFGAGEPGEVVKDRHAPLARLRRLVHREPHLRAAFPRVVRQEALCAAEAGVFRYRLQQ